MVQQILDIMLLLKGCRQGHKGTLRRQGSVQGSLSSLDHSHITLTGNLDQGEFVAEIIVRGEFFHMHDIFVSDVAFLHCNFCSWVLLRVEYNVIRILQYFPYHRLYIK